jgi:translation initiation factor 1
LTRPIGRFTTEAMNQSRLVWSDDPKDKKCPKCHEFMVNCRCQPEPVVKSTNWVAIFRLEKNGRGGKTVTVIDGIPKNELFLKELTKELKQKCGTGGTYLMDKKDGVIEIQGDKREAIKAIFEKKGYKFKGM